MSRPGRDREVSDLEILRYAALLPDPVFTSTEIADHVEMSQQGVYSRLQSLEDDGLVNSSKKGAGRIYWLTYRGREFVHAHSFED